LKFLIDAQLPPSLEAWFEAEGYEARHVASLSGLDAPDADIWNLAISDGYIIVTKDRDFVEWARSRTPKARVLWIRFGNMRREVLHLRLEAAWPELLEFLVSDVTVIEVGR
jgi:predicted nuclease of predicted toxin-antitoxin system